MPFSTDTKRKGVLKGTTISTRKLTVRQFAVCVSSPQLALLPHSGPPSGLLLSLLLPYRNLCLLLLILLLCLLPINTCLLYLFIRWGKAYTCESSLQFLSGRGGSTWKEAVFLWHFIRVWKTGIVCLCVWSCGCLTFSYFSKWVNPQPILHSKTLGGFSSVSFPWDHETSIKKRFAFSVSKLSVLRQEPRKQQSSHRPSEFVQCFPAQPPAGECSTGIQDGIPPWTSSVLPWASVSTTWSYQLLILMFLRWKQAASLGPVPSCTLVAHFSSVCLNGVSLFRHLATQWHLGYFQVLTTVNKVVINKVHMQFLLRHSLYCSGIKGCDHRILQQEHAWF